MKQPDSNSSGRMGIFLALYFFALAATAGATVFGFLSGWFFLFELVSHFRPLLAAASLLVFLLSGLLWFKEPEWAIRSAVVALFLLGLNFMTYYSLFVSPGRGGASNTELETTLKVLHFNINYQHPDPAAALNWVSEEDPDLFLLVELTPEIASLVSSKLGKKYRHQVVSAMAHPFGIGLYSKFPFKKKEIRIPPRGAEELQPTRPDTFIDAIIELENDRQVRVIGMHPYPPKDPDQVFWRNQYVREVQERVKGDLMPKILLGDLNLTPWHPLFKEFCSALGLVSAQLGYGLSPTWPVLGGRVLPSFFGVTLDHVLVSQEFQVTSYSVPAVTGSDHLPVVVELKY